MDRPESRRRMGQATEGKNEMTFELPDPDIDEPDDPEFAAFMEQYSKARAVCQLDNNLDDDEWDELHGLLYGAAKEFGTLAVKAVMRFAFATLEHSD